MFKLFQGVASIDVLV